MQNIYDTSTLRRSHSHYKERFSTNFSYEHDYFYQPSFDSHLLALKQENKYLDARLH